MNFPKLMKKINSKTQETQDTQQDKEESTPRSIVRKLHNTKEKSQKEQTAFKETKIRTAAAFTAMI